ncbi:MAG: OmpA family protein [Methyloprofundus sp.]|nr:OmpA family protein [Methyloprofundus sp.]
MLKKVIPLASAIGLVLLSGCTTQPTSYPSFTAAPIAQNSPTAAYTQKTNTVFVILDSSASTAAAFEADSSGASKLDIEKQFLYRFNKTLPTNANLSSGLLSYGFGSCVGFNTSDLGQGITRHSTGNFQANLDQALCASGGSPLDSALAAASTELDNAPGNIALLIISDGQQVPPNTLVEAQALESKFGDRLCIYSAWVGNEGEKDGQFVLQELSNIANCGNSVNAADLTSSSAMAGFTENMLYTRTALTPAPYIAPVVRSTDEDNDGVDDAYDQCLGTPTGAVVNSQGCWSYSRIDFGFDDTTISPAYAPLFDNAAYVLQQHPSITVELDGHTDSTGPEAYNLGLSERRAQAVKDHLVSQGVDPSRLTVQGFGESQPIADNDTAEGRAENRRVGFKITSR